MRQARGYVLGVSGLEHLGRSQGPGSGAAIASPDVLRFVCGARGARARAGTASPQICFDTADRFRMRTSIAAHPGLVSTNIYNRNGGRPSIWQLLFPLPAYDLDHGALTVLYAAFGDVPGESFAGPAHLAHMRGALQLIDRSATARHPDLARRLWTLSEELTDVSCPI